MPIDASIPFQALGGQGNPLQSFAQIQQIKNAQLQNQEGQFTLANLGRQQAVQDAVTQAAQNSRGDRNEFIRQLSQGPAAAKAPEFQKQFDEEQKTKLENASKQLGLVGQIASSVTDQPTYEQALRTAQGMGLDPSSLGLGPQYDPKQIEAIKNHSLSVKDQIDNSLKTQQQAETARHNQVDEANSAARIGSEQLSAKDEMRYRMIQQQLGLGRTVSPEDKAWSAAFEKSKTLGPRTTFALQQGGGAAPKPDLPADMPLADKYKTFGAQGNMIRGIVEGRQKPPSGFAMKSPYWQNVMNGVYQIDPEWSEQRAQLRTGMTTGPQSKEIGAINVALGHVAVLNDAVDALKNTDVRFLNSIANRLGLETGNSAPAVFKTIVHRVGPELSKAYLGAGGSAGERGSDEKDFDENLAPQTIKDNASESAKLLRSKIGYYEHLWDSNKAPGQKSFDEQFMTPEAKQSLQKLNPQTSSAGVSVSAPDGKKYTFKDQASADAFKQKAGIK